MIESTARLATLMPTPVAMPDAMEPMRPDIMPPPCAGAGAGAAAGAAAGGGGRAAAGAGGGGDELPYDGGGAALAAGAGAGEAFLAPPRGIAVSQCDLPTSSVMGGAES